jgi:hypothetical protein
MPNAALTALALAANSKKTATALKSFIFILLKPTYLVAHRGLAL